MIKYREDWLFAILFLFAHLFIGFDVVAEMGIWHDEAFSIFHAQQTLTELFANFQSEPNPPLYFILLHYWIQWFGIGMLAVKSLSIIFSAFTALPLYFLGIRIQGRFTAIFTSLMFLFSNLLFDFSHEVRAFALVGFLAVSSFLLFFKILKNSSLGSIMLFTLLNALLVYSHYISVLVPIVQFICLWLFRNKMTKFWVIVSSFPISALLVMPQIIRAFSNMPDETFWLAQPVFFDLNYTLLKLLGNDTAANFIFIPLSAFPILILLNRRFKIFNAQFNVKYALVLLSWFFIPIILCFFLAQFTPVFLVRYLLFSTFGSFLCLSYLTATLNIRKGVRNVLFTIYVVFFITEFKPINFDVEKWSLISDFINNYKDDNTVVMISANYKIIDFSYYHDLGAFHDYNSLEDRMKDKRIYAINTVNNLDIIPSLEKYNRIILILSHDKVVDPNHSLENYLLEHQYVKCNDFEPSYGSRILVFQKSGYPCLNLIQLDKKIIENNGFHWQQTTFRNKNGGKLVIDYELQYDSCPSCNSKKYLLNQEKDIYTVNPSFPFSPTFHTSTKGIVKIEIEAEITPMKNTDALVVLSIENGDEQLLIDVSEFSADHDFSLLQTSNLYPFAREDHLIKIYLYNPEESNVQLKKLKIRIFRFDKTIDDY